MESLIDGFNELLGSVDRRRTLHAALIVVNGHGAGVLTTHLLGKCYLAPRTLLSSKGVLKALIGVEYLLILVILLPFLFLFGLLLSFDLLGALVENVVDHFAGLDYLLEVCCRFWGDLLQFRWCLLR